MYYNTITLMWLGRFVNTFIKKYDTFSCYKIIEINISSSNSFRKRFLFERYQLNSQACFSRNMHKFSQFGQLFKGGIKGHGDK